MAQTFQPKHLSQAQVAALPTSDLATIVRGTVPTGVFAAEVVWARAELCRRRVSA